MSNDTDRKTYLIEYETDGKIFCADIMAIDYYHAVLMLEDLKKTGRVIGELEERIEWN